MAGYWPRSFVRFYWPRLCLGSSPWASSPGRSSCGAGICIETSLSEMLICGDDISNDVVTPGFCFHVFFNVCLHSRLFALRPDWQKSDSLVDGEPQANWRWNSNSSEVVASSPSFSRPAARAPQRACSQAILVRKNWKKNLANIQSSCWLHGWSMTHM